MLKIHAMKPGKSAVCVALLACACGGQDPSPAATGGSSAAGNASPAAGTRFSGSYEVPVEPALSAAALFTLADVRWAVDGDTARLAYDLPRELIGKSLRVDFSGAVASDGSARLSGDAGSADCTIGAVSVVCQEDLQGLLPLEPDLDVVEALAKDDYAGPAADRLDVARRFAADPIGIAQVDLAARASTQGERD